MKTKKQMGMALVLIAFLIALDQITKYLAVLFLKEQAAIPIIKEVFELKYLENQSAAFGMDPISLLHEIFHFQAFESNPQLFLDMKMGFFVLFTIIIVIVMAWVYTRIPNEKRYIFMDYILIFFMAGALGNFIDRVWHNYVIDFLYFKLLDFPIFNVADIYVTCAAFVMLALGIFYYKDEDIDRIFPPKAKKED